MDSAPKADNELDSEGLGGIILGFINWFLTGLYQPIYSLPFYRKGVKRGFGQAILFLCVFAVVLSAVSAIRFSSVMSSMPEDMRQVPTSGDLQSITIKDGIARVEGTQPWFIRDEKTFIGVDTTGEITEIDTRQFSQGYLLARTSFHYYSNGEYERLDLRDLNDTFGNPIVINEEVINKFWDIFSNILLIFVIGGPFTWNFVLRLIYLALLAVILWSIARNWRKDIEYEHALICGIYVSVPIIYLTWGLNQLGTSCFCIHSILLLTGWIVVLLLVFPPTESASGAPGITKST